MYVHVPLFYIVCRSIRLWLVGSVEYVVDPKNGVIVSPQKYNLATTKLDIYCCVRGDPDCGPLISISDNLAIWPNLLPPPPTFPNVTT